MKLLIIALFLLTSCLQEQSIDEQLIGPTWVQTGFDVNGTPYNHPCGFGRHRLIFQDEQVIYYPYCEHQDSHLYPYTLVDDVINYNGKDWHINLINSSSLVLQYNYPQGGEAVHSFRAL